MKGIVSFYEKRGCRTNAQQKKQLEAAGYVVQSIDLLEKDWDTVSLRKFFTYLPTHDCVNARAPQITSGEFDPNSLSEDDLLVAMARNPILIKRPLIFFRGEFACGFNNELVSRLLGEDGQETECSGGSECLGH